MNIEQILESGVLSNGEAVTRYFKGRHFADGKEEKGLIVFTNKRFLFLQKPSGWRAKGLNALQTYLWGNVLSVSTTGLLSKKLNLSIRTNDRTEVSVYSCGRMRDVVKAIIENKRACENKT